MNLSTTFDLLLFKTAANLRTEVSRYYLNYLWWGIEPVLSMGVFYLVFGVFMNRGTPDYVAFLLVGLTWWNWFARSVQNGSNSITEARNLMLQIDIPKFFFPLEVCLRDSFKQFFVCMLLLIFLVIKSSYFSITWIALPYIVLIQFLFIVGSAVFLSNITPFMPDLRFVVNTAIQLMFFGSGIFYKIEDVVLQKHLFIIYLNPVAGLLKAYRDILIYSTWPDWNYLHCVLIGSLVLCLIAFSVNVRLDKLYPKVCNR